MFANFNRKKKRMFKKISHKNENQGLFPSQITQYLDSNLKTQLSIYQLLKDNPKIKKSNSVYIKDKETKGEVSTESKQQKKTTLNQTERKVSQKVA